MRRAADMDMAMIMRMITGMHIGTSMRTGMDMTMGMGMTTGMGMGMDTAITATDQAVWSRLLAWMSPSFPTGAFSYSHGLETAVEDGSVHDAVTLGGYVGTVLAHGAGRTDSAFLALAWRAQMRDDLEALAEIADVAAAMRGSAELALESHAQGRAFLSTVRAAWPHARLDAAAACLAQREVEIASPIAVAIAGAVWAIPLDALLLAHLHAMAANLVSAGVRLVPLGQTDGQRVVAALEDPIRAAARRASEVTGIDAVCAAAPVIDLLSIRHETQYTRLFRS
jgi:urease accessory protein